MSTLGPDEIPQPIYPGGPTNVPPAPPAAPPAPPVAGPSSTSPSSTSPSPALVGGGGTPPTGKGGRKGLPAPVAIGAAIVGVIVIGLGIQQMVGGDDSGERPTVSAQNNNSQNTSNTVEPDAGGDLSASIYDAATNFGFDDSLATCLAGYDDEAVLASFGDAPLDSGSADVAVGAFSDCASTDGIRELIVSLFRVSGMDPTTLDCWSRSLQGADDDTVEELFGLLLQQDYQTAQDLFATSLQYC